MTTNLPDGRCLPDAPPTSKGVIDRGAAAADLFAQLDADVDEIEQGYTEIFGPHLREGESYRRSASCSNSSSAFSMRCASGWSRPTATAVGASASLPRRAGAATGHAARLADS